MVSLDVEVPVEGERRDREVLDAPMVRRRQGKSAAVPQHRIGPSRSRRGRSRCSTTSNATTASKLSGSNGQGELLRGVPYELLLRVALGGDLERAGRDVHPHRLVPTGGERGDEVARAAAGVEPSPPATARRAAAPAGPVPAGRRTAAAPPAASTRRSNARCYSPDRDSSNSLRSCTFASMRRSYIAIRRQKSGPGARRGTALEHVEPEEPDRRARRQRNRPVLRARRRRSAVKAPSRTIPDGSRSSAASRSSSGCGVRRTRSGP